MAIYQFWLTVVPRQGVLRKFGVVPEKLVVNYPERKVHFELEKEGLLEGSDVFTDALLQDWWSFFEIQPIEIPHRLDRFLGIGKQSEYVQGSFFWKRYVFGEVDNDAHIDMNTQTGKIESFIFRADLREENLKFLQEMVEMAKVYDWLLMDSNGNLANPNLKEVLELVRKSNAFRFVSDPLQFFQDLESGKISIEGSEPSSPNLN